MSAVAIIDSGGANLASLKFALARLGSEATVTSDVDEIRDAERVILPGVGAAANAMQKLHETGLAQLIPQLTQPVLGICLGLQLLCAASEEEQVACLGVFDGVARKLPGSPTQPVPNMGWCPIDNCREHPLLSGLQDGDYFYFVHSYALDSNDQTIASAEHAIQFAAIVAANNFVAAQFHPERSSAAGARLLQNFLDWRP